MRKVLGRVENILRRPTALWSSVGEGARVMRPGVDLRAFILPCLTGIALGLLCLISPLLALVLCMGAIIFTASVSKPIILCYLVISATMLTSGIERGRLFPIFTGNEISVLGAVAIALLVLLADKRRKVAIPGFFWLALIFLVGGTVFVPIAIYLLQGTQLTFDTGFKMFSSIQYFIIFFVFAALPESEGDRRKIIWWMLAFGLIVAVVGLAQGVHIGPVDRLLGSLYASSHESVAARAGRITSLLGSWNSLGIYMMAICLICWAVLFEIERPIGRLLVMGIMAISVLCLIASGSYAGIIGLAIGLILIQILSQRKARSMPILITGFFGVILAILLFYPFLQPLIEKRLTDQFQSGGWMPETLAYRIQVWDKIFIPAIRAHFPWPVYPTVPSWYAWQFEESQYILLLFRTGLPGFVSYLAWIGITIVWLYRSFKRSQGFNKAIASAALTLVVVLVIAGFTNEVFSFAGTIDYLWIMLGLVANAAGNT
jgi:hypothetical protein